MTTNLHVATFPAASLKLIVTCVDPMLKACPELCELVLVGAAPELSVAVGNWNVATAEGAPCAANNEMSDGQLEITGGIRSAGGAGD